MFKGLGLIRTNFCFGGHILIGFVGIWYVTYIYNSDLPQFLVFAGSIVATLVGFASLSFRFAGVLESEQEKTIAGYAGEKLFYAAICLTYAGLAGALAMKLQEAPPPLLWGWLTWTLITALKIFGALLLGPAGSSVSSAHNLLSQLFMERWESRLFGTTSKSKEQSNQVDAQSGIEVESSDAPTQQN